MSNSTSVENEQKQEISQKLNLFNQWCIEAKQSDDFAQVITEYEEHQAVFTKAIDKACYERDYLDASLDAEEDENGNHTERFENLGDKLLIKKEEVTIARTGLLALQRAFNDIVEPLMERKALEFQQTTDQALTMDS